MLNCVEHSLAPPHLPTPPHGGATNGHEPGGREPADWRPDHRLALREQLLLRVKEEEEDGEDEVCSCSVQSILFSSQR